MKIAIIGGSGRMGKWFARFFSGENEVIITGRDKQKLLKVARELRVRTASNLEAVKEADLIVISVLLPSFEDVVKEIAPHIRPDQKIIDITSVKEMPVKIMHKYIKKGLVLGTHPLFGPSAKDINQNFVLTPINEREKKFAREFKKYLEKKGFTVIITTPKEHDKIMSTVLGLTHFIGLSVANTWLSLNYKKLRKMSGTSFKILENLVKNVLSSDPEFYADLQMSLPGIEKIECLFKKNVEEWLEIVKKKEREKFAKKMANMEKYFKKIDSLK